MAQIIWTILAGLAGVLLGMMAGHTTAFSGQMSQLALTGAFAMAAMMTVVASAVIAGIMMIIDVLDG